VAVVLQSDLFNPTHPSVTVAPITTLLRNDAPAFRLTVEPSADNGLRLTSQIMIDKVTTFRREKVRPARGTLDRDTMVRVTRALALWFGIA
jgi:mRNA interferase MazF